MPTASRGHDPVFADAFFFIALLNPSDAHHADAVRQAEGLVTSILTTHWVLTEVADALCVPSYRVEVARFLRELADDPGTEIVPADPLLFGRGLDLYAQRPDKGWSLTDCISFVVMSDRQLTDALTGDRHFEQAGFRALFRQA